MNAYPDFIKAVKCTGEWLKEHLEYGYDNLPGAKGAFP